jgi:cytochrome bd-type quinol oxidase subunit 1
MEDPTVIARWQFGFTIVYHYLFPQLTMGLALLLVVLKTLYLRRGEGDLVDVVERAVKKLSGDYEQPERTKRKGPAAERDEGSDRS